jgi:pentatricopeptide repeat protein
MVGPVAGHEARPSALSFAHAYVACMLDGSAAAEARGQRMLQLCHEALKLPVTLSSPSSRATSAGGAASSFTIDPQAAGQLSDADFLAAQKIYLSVLLPSLQLKRQWAACVESVERLEAVADAMAVHRRQRQQQRQQQAASSATAVEGDTASSAVADEYVSPKLLPALYNQAMECCDVSYQAPACVRLMRSLLARQGPAAVELQHYNTLLRVLVRVRDWPAALEVLEHMRASGGENGVRPTLDTWRQVHALLAATSPLEDGVHGLLLDSSSYIGTTADEAGAGAAGSTMAIHNSMHTAQELLRCWTQPDNNGDDDEAGATAASKEAAVFYSTPRTTAASTSSSSSNNIDDGDSAAPAAEPPVMSLSPFLAAAYSDDRSLLAPLLRTVLPPPGLSVLDALQHVIQQRIDDKDRRSKARNA